MSEPKPSPVSPICGAICCAILALLLAANPALRAQSPESSLAEDLQGHSVDPLKSMHGRVVVLLFVRTDCPVSNRYAPLFRSLSEKFRNRANFWLVYPDAAESASQIRAHLTAYNHSLSALRDPHHRLVKLAHATITPEAAVFDSSGKLLYHGRIDNQFEELGAPARAAATTHELADAISAALHHSSVQPDHVNAVGCYISDMK